MPSHLGDVLNLCRFLHVDKDLMVTGKLQRLPNVNTKKKSFDDPKFIVKVLVDSINRNSHIKSGVQIRPMIT